MDIAYQYCPRWSVAPLNRPSKQQEREQPEPLVPRVSSVSPRLAPACPSPPARLSLKDLFTTGISYPQRQSSHPVHGMEIIRGIRKNYYEPPSRRKTHVFRYIAEPSP